jgi:hypothetical protein
MEVSEDDIGNVGTIEPVLPQRRIECCVLVVNGVDLFVLRSRKRVPHSHVYENEPIGSLQQKAAHVERNAILLVRLDSLRPQGLGNDTKHRPSV